jgi:restriction endonuclease S subunit
MGVENNIPEDWVETSIGKVTVVESGGTPSTKNSSYWGDEIPWITPRDLSSFKDVFIEKGDRSISIEGLENSSAKLLPKNTILFSSRAPIGYVVIAQNETATNQGFKNLICDEVNSHFKYFYYLMKYKADFIERLSSGSTFSEASGTLIKSIELNLPPLPEQKAIASILTSFDDKIELLQAQNKTLETIAQTIFKEWFGKYQIGDDLPEGWRVGKFGDIVNPQKGKNITKKQVISGKYPVIAGGIKPSVFHNQCNTKSPVITISASGANAGFVCLYNTPVWSSDSSFIDSSISNSIYFCYVFLKNNQSNLFDKQEGSAIPHIYPKHIEHLDMIIPTKMDIIKYEKTVNPFLAKMGTNTQQIQSLKQIRDTLLPKLMSGKLRVSEFKENNV